MKVIGAGLPRTATTTQMVALEQLGFGPVNHMRHLLGDLESNLAQWEAAADGEPDWDRVFDGFQSMVDWPGARYWRDLIDYYPDAKVLLSVRSGEGWVRSMRETVWGVFHGDSVLRHVSDAQAVVDPHWRRFTTLMQRMTWDDQTGALPGDTSNDESFIQIMERWNDEVKSTVPAERLLVWNPAEGWEPLCDFLEVGVPDEPLPHLNDAASFREGIIGGGLGVLNEWWDKRERPSSGLHGAPVD